MKKTSFARRNALLPRGAGAWSAALLACAVLAVALRLFVPGLLTLAATPLWKASSLAAAATHTTASFFHNPVALQSELDAATAHETELADENAVLTTRVHDLETLLGSRPSAGPGVLAGVLARPPESPYDVLVIDEGSSAGVVEGARAYGPGGIPVGVVTSATAHAARVTLFSAPHVVTNAWVGNARTPMTITGEGGGAFAAAISKDVGVSAGDAIYLSGPGALPFATVTRVDADPSSPAATLRIQAAVNFFSLTWVTVSRDAS